jgi:hypothetical protein
MTTSADPGPDAQAWPAQEEAEREFFDPDNAEHARILGETGEAAERTAQENAGIPWADGPDRTYEQMERDAKALAEPEPEPSWEDDLRSGTPHDVPGHQVVGAHSAYPHPGAEAGHVDPAAAARWHQAQSELVGLIRADNRVLDRAPEAARLLPDSLGDWMEKRVAELEEAEVSELGIDPFG